MLVQVKVEECYWTLEDKKLVHVFLEKVRQIDSYFVNLKLFLSKLGTFPSHGRGQHFAKKCSFRNQKSFYGKCERLKFSKF